MDSVEDRDNASIESSPPLAEAVHATIDAARRDARRLADRAAEAARQRADRTVRRGFDRVAEKLDDTADRFDRVADERLGSSGPRTRAAGSAHSAAGWMEGVASYLRGSDLGSVQDDIERRVREKPLQTLCLAVGAGWFVGRLMRR
jgi:ElaB/YqjD/DUF883 family membrane-anchored ribosome-binding protein